jgi:hypothetical protein
MVNIGKGERRCVAVDQNNSVEVKMKRLSVIVIIATLSMFMSTAVASDFYNGWQWDNNPFRYFHGTFEMTASGSCIHSEFGFKEVDHGWYKAIEAEPGTVYAGTTVMTGTWTFELNGKGTYSDTIYATVTPPVSGVPVVGGVRIFEDSDVPFTYKITGDGYITITEVKPPYLEYTGTVSSNRNTIILIDTPKVKPPAPAGPLPYPFWKILCNASRTLIRVNE